MEAQLDLWGFAAPAKARGGGRVRRARPAAVGRRLRRWSAEEDEAIRSQWCSATAEERMALALSLGRTAEACVARAAALGVRPPRTDRRWTEADDAVLRELYGQRTAAAIGKRLSRTAAAVRSRAIVLGVASVNKPWTPEDDERLLELAESQPTARIARELGRSPSTIYGRLKQLAGGVLEARQTLNAEQVGAILGRSSKTVSGWCRSGALKGVREGEGAEWLITTEAVRRFVLRYPNEVHCRRSEREADLVRLLLGRF